MAVGEPKTQDIFRGGGGRPTVSPAGGHRRVTGDVTIDSAVLRGLSGFIFPSPNTVDPLGSIFSGLGGLGGDPGTTRADRSPGVPAGLALPGAQGGGGVLANLDPSTPPQRPGTVTATETALDDPEVTSTLTTALEEEQSRLQERIAALRQGDDVPVPHHLRQQLEAFEEETDTRIQEINATISMLNQNRDAIEDAFEVGSLFMESQGLPATVEEARENPVVNEALDNIQTAIMTDDAELLDEAIDSLGTLSDADADALEHAFGRDRFFADLEAGIRTQMHNLVQERQDLQRALIDAENIVQQEAHAQQANLWDVTADMTPTGRGLDVLVGGVEPWLENNFDGIISESQAGLVAQTLQAIWELAPSEEELVNEEGEVVETEAIGPQQEAALLDLAGQLGFGPDKAANFVDVVKQSMEQGQKAAVQASQWEDLDILEPGGPALSTGIAEVATELYDDPETVNLMTNSYYLHRLIDARSGGDIHTSKGGNLFGIGALPEFTYEDMGYNIEDLQDNPKEQIEALLVFIGMKFGPGYEGLQTALSAWVHNPETWGDLTLRGGR